MGSSLDPLGFYIKLDSGSGYRLDILLIYNIFKLLFSLCIIIYYCERIQGLKTLYDVKYSRFASYHPIKSLIISSYQPIVMGQQSADYWLVIRPRPLSLVDKDNTADSRAVSCPLGNHGGRRGGRRPTKVADFKASRASFCPVLYDYWLFSQFNHQSDNNCFHILSF